MNPDVVIAVLTGALVIITGIYAWLTWKIAKANERAVQASERSIEAMREQTEAVYRPYITITHYLTHKAILKLVIKNTGSTNAKGLKLDIDRDFHQGDINENYNLAAMPAFTNVIETFPPGAELAFTLGLGSLAEKEDVDHEDSKTPRKFDITATYSYNEKKVSEMTTVDLRPYARTFTNPDPVVVQLKETKEVLEDFVGELKKLAKMRANEDAA